MNKLFCLALIFTSFSYADLDIGEDFEAGDIISAEEFNLKFGKLKNVVGAMSDLDLIGTWDCTNYKLAIDPAAVDEDYKIENGGNGRVGNGYFFSNSGTFIFSEADTETSINSPKNLSVSRNDVLDDRNYLDLKYSLILNQLWLFSPPDEGQTYDGFAGVSAIYLVDTNKIAIVGSPVPGFIGPYPVLGRLGNTTIFCEKRS